MNASNHVIFYLHRFHWMFYFAPLRYSPPTIIKCPVPIFNGIFIDFLCIAWKDTGILQNRGWCWTNVWPERYVVSFRNKIKVIMGNVMWIRRILQNVLQYRRIMQWRFVMQQWGIGHKSCGSSFSKGFVMFSNEFQIDIPTKNKKYSKIKLCMSKYFDYQKVLNISS
jgi:hypothetical protein